MSKLIVADWSSIELRVLAWLSGDQRLISEIKAQDLDPKEKVYTKFASKLYGREIDKNKDEKEYKIGKAAILGLGYGMGAKRFRAQVYTSTGIELDEVFAKDTVDLYRATYTGVPQFWRNCEKMLGKIYDGREVSFLSLPSVRTGKNCITLPLGLQVKYPDLGYIEKWFNRKKVKEWYFKKYSSQTTVKDTIKVWGGFITENLCQALAGEICKEAILRLLQKGIIPVGQVHDELLVVCEDEDLDYTKTVVEWAMTSPISWWPELPLQIEMGVGQTWADGK